MKIMRHMRIVQKGTRIRFFQMTGTGMAPMVPTLRWCCCCRDVFAIGGYWVVSIAKFVDRVEAGGWNANVSWGCGNYFNSRLRLSLDSGENAIDR
jgi:hypothetical protein